MSISYSAQTVHHSPQQVWFSPPRSYLVHLGLSFQTPNPCASCFIKQKNFWIFKDGSRDCNPLLLSPGKLSTSLSNCCVITLKSYGCMISFIVFIHDSGLLLSRSCSCKYIREVLNEACCIRELSCSLDFFKGCILFSIGNILPDGCHEEQWFLINKANLLPYPV